MAEAKGINVQTKQTNNFVIAMRHAVIWAYLVGAEYAAHTLFGGSWVIDLMVLVSLCLIIAQIAVTQTGASVSMTKTEIREWVAAGMPADIKAWRERIKLAKSAA